MNSFFHRLYKYKQCESINQKENFLTEILSYSLTADKAFRKHFLKKIGYNDIVKTFTCETQYIKNKFGRPDIFISINNDTVIIIECKIDSTQQKSQLNRYCDLLQKNPAKRKYLIYLTKYFEETSKFPVSFKHIRWYEIYNLLNNCANHISIEFANFLIQEKMSTIISFNLSDKNALKNIKEKISKMDEFLARIKDSLISNTGLKSGPCKLLNFGFYGIESKFQGGALVIGFWEQEDDNQMQLGLSIENINHKHKSFKVIKKELKVLKWEYYENEGKGNWQISNDFSLFFTNGKFDSNQASDFIAQEILKIKKWF